MVTKTKKSFSRTVYELMNDDDIADRVKEMGLSKKVTALIQEQFDQVQNMFDAEAEANEEDYAGPDGVLILYVDADAVFDDLAKAMGKPAYTGKAKNPNPEVLKVFNRFFEE